MPLETQTIDIPLTGGLDTKLDPVIPDKARLLALVNGAFDKSGTLTRRNGWNRMLTSSPTLTPIETATFGDQLLVVDETTVGAPALYSASTASETLISRGRVPGFSLTRESVTGSGQNVASMDSATSGTYTCFTWLQSSAGGGVTGTGIGACIIDDNTGSVVVAATTIVTATVGPPRVSQVGTAGGGKFVIFWVQGTTLKAVTVDSAGTVSAASNIGSSLDASTGCPVDVIPMPDGTAICAFCPAASFRVTTFAIDDTLSISATLGTITTSRAAVYSISLCALSSSSVAIMVIPLATTIYTAIIAYAGNVPGGLTLAHSEANSTVAAGGVSGTVGTGVVTSVLFGGSVFFFSARFDTSGSPTQWYTALLSSANVVSSITAMSTYSLSSNGYLYGPFLASKAFLAGGLPCVAVTIMSDLQPTLFVINSSSNLVAIAEVSNLAMTHSQVALSYRYGTVPTPTTLASGQISIPATVLLNNSQTTGARVLLAPGRTGCGSSGIISATQSFPPLWHATAGQYLFFSGSYLGMYDGLAASEAFFPHYPESLISSSGTGSGAVTGSFGVCAVYEWLDGKGNRHQSAPAVPATIALSANTTLAFSAQPLLLGSRVSTATVVFYRTVNGGQTYYRATPVTAPNANNNTASAVTQNDTTVVTNPSADPITANEILYTTGGVLPNDAPSACVSVCEYQGRLAYDNAEIGNLWYISQAQQPGRGFQFSADLSQNPTDAAAGPISGMSPLDDKLILGSTTRKFITAGQPPDATGSNNGVSPPQLLSSGVGFFDQRASVVVPDSVVDDGGVQIQKPGGLMHSTLQGLFMLDRALVDRNIGFPVAAKTVINRSAYPISSGCLLPDRGQIRFTIPATGEVVVYDVVFGQWSSFLSSVNSPATACVWPRDDSWVFADSDNSGHVYAEDDATNYLDTAAVIPVSFVTANLKLGQLQGYQRAKRAIFFGAWGANSTLTITAQVDYQASVSSYSSGSTEPSQVPGEFGRVTGILGTTANPTAYLSSQTNVLTSPDGQRWQVRWHLPVQKCEAIQFTACDTPAAGTSGAGISFSGLAIEIGAKRGTKRLQSNQSL